MKVLIPDKTDYGHKGAIDIEGGDLDIYVDGQLILHIGQVSDDKVVNLFLYPKGNLVSTLIIEETSSDKCTHEILVERI